MNSNIELRRQIKALRCQVAKLEKSCEEREGKIIELFERIEPFFPAMSHDAKRVLREAIGEEI